jgi:hypothetical protein
MFIEVVNVAYEADEKSYRLTIKITNVEGRREETLGSELLIFGWPLTVYVLLQPWLDCDVARAR